MPVFPQSGGIAGRDADSAAETMTQLRGSSLLLAGRLVAVFVGFVTQVLLVRYLTKSDYGAFTYGLAVVVTARIVVSLGHNRTITRFLAVYRERADHARLLGTLLMECLLIVGLGAVLAGAVFVSRNLLAGALIDDAQTVAVLSVLVLLAPLEALDELFEGTFAVYDRARTIFLRQHVLAPLLRLSVVAALIAGDASVMFLAAGYVAATVVGVALYVVLLHRLLLGNGVLGHDRPAPRMPAREVFGYSFPLLTSELVYVCVNTVSVMLLGFFRGPVPVAALRAVLPLAELNLLVRRQFLRLFLPLASRLHARGDTAALRTAYARTTSWLAVLTFPVAAVTVPLAEPVTVAVFGERYAGSAPYLALLAAGFYVNAALGFNAEVLQAAARLRRLVAANVTTAAVNVALVLLLVPSHGALGVAVANAVALVVQNVVNQTALRTSLGAAFPTPLPRVYVVLTAALFALAAVQLTADPPLGVGLALVAVVSLAVVFATRRALGLADVFPRLRRVPLLRHLVA
jgi:O-antigen/teichoic acid export membrane protein